MEKKAVQPSRGPAAQGPYSSAIAFGNLVFVSGQGPVDPDSKKIIRGDVVDQMKVAVENVRLILEEAGSSLAHVLKVTVYLSDMEDFQRMNDLYRTYFGPIYPARTTIEAARLPLDISIEIDVIAAVPS
jgi:2-iminobutanoate/2-iminopropanoate deaminase